MRAIFSDLQGTCLLSPSFRMTLVQSDLHRNAFSDWWEGSHCIDIWWTLSWFDIVLRYRRSMLGPL